MNRRAFLGALPAATLMPLGINSGVAPNASDTGDASEGVTDTDDTKRVSGGIEEARGFADIEAAVTTGAPSIRVNSAKNHDGPCVEVRAGVRGVKVYADLSPGEARDLAADLLEASAAADDSREFVDERTHANFTRFLGFFDVDHLDSLAAETENE